MTKDNIYSLNPIMSLIRVNGLTNPQFVWENVSTMEELFYCNKEFIKNNLSESFYHLGPLALDSLPLTEYLLELHDKGVFTYGGQGSLIDYDKWIDTEWRTPEGNLCGKWFASIEQKPYLECIIDKAHINNLLLFIKNINENMSHDGINYLIFGSNVKFTNINEHKYNVTRTKSYSKISDKDVTEWEYPSNLWNSYSFADNISYFDLYPELYNVIAENYIVLQLTTKNYGSDIILEKTLLDFLNNL
jgi:hypothetical protein